MHVSYKFAFRRIIIRKLGVRKQLTDLSRAVALGEKNHLKCAPELITKKNQLANKKRIRNDENTNNI